ncbi:MAG: RNA-binding domain-containing protein [Candidatus Thorarchaeota archaeon]
MQLEIKSVVFPTEDKSRVQAAMTKLFPTLSFDQGDSLITSFTDDLHDLDWLRFRIFEQRIIDAVKSHLIGNSVGYTTLMMLDKQAAFVGRVRLIDETDETPPLGLIELRFTFTNETDFQQFLSWFTPLTKDGHIVFQ